MNKFLPDKDKNSYRRMQGKRTLAESETCKIDLKDVLPDIFQAFSESMNKVNEMLSNFPPESRSRVLEASIVQSCFAEYVFKKLERKAFWGKYKRLIVRDNGYIILFKKLNNKGYPMNINTQNVQSILNQNQVLDLFAESTDYNDEPILYFGYQKDRFGQFVNEQIIYIDEGKIVFSLSSKDFETNLIQIENKNRKPEAETPATPKLKDINIIKKTN